jgi:uncharacterized protein (DUF697 family)
MGYVETIGRVLHGNFEAATDREKLEAAREITVVCSVAAGAVALEPIPFADVALLAPIQVAMVQGIGQAYGHKLDTKTVVEMLATIGGALVTRGVLGSVLKLVPVFGWAASASMAYAMTYAIGEVSHAYFKGGRGLSAVEMKTMFRSVYEATRTEQEAASPERPPSAR